MSTAIQGLSMNCPALPASISTVLRYRIGSVVGAGMQGWPGEQDCVASPFSLLLRSMNRARNNPPIFVLRLRAMPL